jgi:hypothetical protein
MTHFLFGLMFLTCTIAGMIAWLRWSGSMSLVRKIHAGQFIVGGVLSGVFLLRVRFATPKTNRNRLFALFLVLWLPQTIVDVFS